MAETVGFRAHARLLTMLGEQLIKNERVALVELIKNAYDADATVVTVDFRGFSEDLKPSNNASIAITDNGIGMTEALVRSAWMNPATPSKALVKIGEPETTRGRVLQGEKGIGRFATFKLGSEVTLVTRAVGAPSETTLFVDITALDGKDDGHRVDLDAEFFLDQVPALLDAGTPDVFDGEVPISSDHGTQLRIAGLRSHWGEVLVKGAFADVARLQPLMWGRAGAGGLTPDFDVQFFRDGTKLPFVEERDKDFEVALDRAVLAIRDGRYDAPRHEIRFNLNEREIVLGLDSAVIRGLRPFKDRFLKDERGKDVPPDTSVVPACGSFGFEFFVFDLTPSAPAAHALDYVQANVVKSHRIYLYRDGIRVYPYGDADDDWLEIDSDRGTEGAGRSLSNDQTVGYATITQSENPGLKDKTSREGLIDSGNAVGDFKALIKTVLRYARQQYQPYLDSKDRVRRRSAQVDRVDTQFDAIRADPSTSKAALGHLALLESAVASERQLAAMQLARTEQLAGVGLSIETASHDLILTGGEALRTAKQVVGLLELADMRGEPVYMLATQLVRQLEFVNSRFKDVQGLFVSTRQKPARVDVIKMLRRVRAIYERLHSEKNIEFTIADDAALVAVSTEAAVLQLLINLVDNATYWLLHKLVPSGEKRIISAFTLDEHTLVISDNGPGVQAEDVPHIFEPFYSGKGEDGKGLGLYIATQNGLRGGFTVACEPVADDRSLPGANFVTRFGRDGG